jgi:hypothetical protein
LGGETGWEYTERSARDAEAGGDTGKIDREIRVRYQGDAKEI